jgi:hypothetical protein
VALKVIFNIIQGLLGIALAVGIIKGVGYIIGLIMFRRR